MRKVHEKRDVIALIAEIFRELGYEGASMGRITARTGLGKGSLYHFFPDGKEQMAREVLAHVDRWFEEEVFTPLREAPPAEGIDRMWRSVAEYFQSGRRICLVGAFALDATRDPFAQAIRSYFQRWLDALTEALVRLGWDAAQARPMAEQVVGGIQGALVLARAMDDDGVFTRVLAQLATQTALPSL
ncbi:TetR/AcrR family transcriptional regulator [Rhodospirillum sp. A1_3_36]|uniref:TetR/AcrR family transcriptional regulator n=1 Tax=Rhodospirillum sp. A1_3_36 TaxID=3391666 RepID=UPI0039A4FA07